MNTGYETGSMEWCIINAATVLAVIGILITAAAFFYIAREWFRIWEDF